MDITHVEVLHDHVVRLRFADAVEKSIDLDPYLHGPVFAEIRSDPVVFASVKVDPDAGTIVRRTAPISPPTCCTKAGARPGWSRRFGRAERALTARRRLRRH